MKLTQRNAAVVEAVRSGRKMRDVAKEFGISFQRVGQICINSGLRTFGRPRSNVDPANRDHAVHLFMRGMPITHAAESAGVPRGYLRYHLVTKGMHTPVNEQRPWTDEEVADLRRSYLVESARVIANRLGRTRNEVIGKARRLGLCLPFRTYPVRTAREARA